jgi:hypothetical protein
LTKRELRNIPGRAQATIWLLELTQSAKLGDRRSLWQVLVITVHDVIHRKSVVIELTRFASRPDLAGRATAVQAVQPLRTR